MTTDIFALSPGTSERDHFCHSQRYVRETATHLAYDTDVTQLLGLFGYSGRRLRIESVRYQNRIRHDQIIVVHVDSESTHCFKTSRPVGLRWPLVSTTYGLRLRMSIVGYQSRTPTLHIFLDLRQLLRHGVAGGLRRHLCQALGLGLGIAGVILYCTILYYTSLYCTMWVYVCMCIYVCTYVSLFLYMHVCTYDHPTPLSQTSLRTRAKSPAWGPSSLNPGPGQGRAGTAGRSWRAGWKPKGILGGLGTAAGGGWPRACMVWYELIKHSIE